MARRANQVTAASPMTSSHFPPINCGESGAPSAVSARYPRRKMIGRILMVSAIFPYPNDSGHAMRTWAILRSLAANGYEVDLLAFGKPAEVNGGCEEVRRVCRSVEVVPHALTSLSSRTDYWRRVLALASPLPFAVERFRSAGMKEKIRSWLQTRPVDAILSDTPYPAINFPSVLPVPLILDNHNIEHILLQRYLAHEPNPVKRFYASLEWQKLRRWEQQVCSKADLAMVCSEADREELVKLCPYLPVAVVPNSVDVDEYSQIPAGDGLTIVYSGAMDWHPNRDAVRFFVCEILPELRARVPGVKFLVAGRGPSVEFRRIFAGIPGIEFTGAVPDMRAEIAKAAVCVVPLRIGSGTRLKILEAAAMTKPIVSTRLGAEGLNFREGEEILLADTPRDFALSVERLLRDAPLSRSLGCAARSRVERQYSFPVLRAAVRQAMEQWRGTEAGGAGTEPALLGKGVAL